MNKPITPEEMKDWVNTAWGASLKATRHPVPDDVNPDALETVEIEVDDAHVVANFRERLAQAIEQMPFGDTAASFATFVREFK